MVIIFVKKTAQTCLLRLLSISTALVNSSKLTTKKRTCHSEVVNRCPMDVTCTIGTGEFHHVPLDVDV